MQPITARKASNKGDKLKLHERLKDETATKKPVDEKLKKTSYDVSTPRSFLQKASTADIYAQKIKNAAQSARAPKKVKDGVARSNVSPMKDLLKSSPSSVSQISARTTYDTAKRISQKKVEAKTSLLSARSSKALKTAKDLPISNVTVNSPIAKRRLNLESDSKELAAKSFDRGDSKEVGKIQPVRQRTKTRTLEEDEVMVLKPEVTQNNNAEILKLSQKVSAKSTAYYVDLDGDKPEKKEKKSDEDEVSYEDDFESYESDFESYHSDRSTGSTDQQSDEQQSGGQEIEDGGTNSRSDASGTKETKDEEKMLDSGSFDLRDSQRSATRKPPLGHILEGSETEDQRPSLPDEGFQEMTTSLRHVDVLDRPLFIDFSKSKESKRKKKISEQFRQRAKDLLSMITLHEMSYSLFEMKPIPYDLYMATFGRSNYTQIAVQTFDDGITEEVQTDEVLSDNKWTQHPVEFSKHDVYLNGDVNKRKNSLNDEDYLSKFTFLIKEKADESNNEISIDTDKEYKENPLRILFEQRDGVGKGEMLPYENYKTKIESKSFDVSRLRKFLKRVENNVSNILKKNSGTENVSELVKSSRLPFSRGHLTVITQNTRNQHLSFLESSKTINILFSDTKSNLMMTVHGGSRAVGTEKCFVCLWDISAASREPVKILVAIDNIAVARFRGGTDGLFIAALDDGSIHLWDLSEETGYRSDIASDNNTTADWVEIKPGRKTQGDTERAWIFGGQATNQRNLPCALQACAFTSSAANMAAGEAIERVVGLEVVASRATGSDGGRKVFGQICSLQRVGILKLWAIIQEKTPTTQDSGKAFWSKMKLEPTQKISLIDFLDFPTKDISVSETEIVFNFNLNAAKRRLSNRKLEKKSLRARAKSAQSIDSDRPVSASTSKVLPAGEEKVTQAWESGIVCYDLKVTQINKMDTYLVAKNCGEVLCCTRIAGAVKVNRISVATDTSSITCLDASPHGWPYFLAATDSGTVNLCSVEDARVLLTLDCRNLPPSEKASDKCQSDHKGRYVSSVTVQPPVSIVADGSKLSVSSVHWSRTNPCCVYTLASNAIVAWDLTHSDICARSVSLNAARACAHSGDVLALLTPEGEVQVHKTAACHRNDQYSELFQKYVSLL